MVASGLMIAQMTEAKAVRDSVFLSHFPATALPSMTLIAALFALLSGYAGSRLIRAVSPDRFAPLGFLISGLLQIGERGLLLRDEQLAACAIYLHVFAINLLLTSSFWSLMNEHYDPHSAKRAFGKIGGAGTLGGVLGGLIAERVAAHSSVTALILVTASLHLACAAALFRFTRNYRPAHSEDHSRAEKHNPVRHVLRKTPYLLQVASLMIAVSIAAALLDFLFKSQAAATIPKGPALTRFFAVFYTVTGLLGVAVQAFFSSAMLGRLGLSNTVSLLPLTVLAGGGWILASFGFFALIAVRAGEVILRGSLFRAAYEIFYTPVPTADKRAVKAIIDISGERLGDIIGSGILGLLLLLHLSGAVSILCLSIGFSGVALILARRLGRSYRGALESSLRKQSVRLGPVPVREDFGSGIVELPQPETVEDEVEPQRLDSDPVVLDVSDLRSASEGRIRRALARIEDPHPLIVHQLIELLGDDRYAFFAMDHLRRAAPEHVGQLSDVLLDSRHPYPIRKRIPLILVVANSQRAVDNLVNGLSDPEFLIRFRCALAMSQIIVKHPEISVNKERIWQVLEQELQVSREVWEERRILEVGSLAEPDADAPVERPGEASLEYAFVLLGLVLPLQPVSMAFRALQSDDRYLRGTALEYLQNVLPAPAWKSLQTLIGDSAPQARTAAALKSAET